MLVVVEGELAKTSLEAELGTSPDTDLGLVLARLNAAVEFELEAFGYVDGEAEILTPVRRNLLCFLVCSLAWCIGMSHSLHSIALSSWQNNNARLSYHMDKDLIPFNNSSR